MNKENLSNSKKEEKGVEPMVFFGPVERTILEKGYVPAMDFYNENENCCNEEEYRPYVEKLWGDSLASKEINNLDNTDIIAEECDNIKSDEGGLIKGTNVCMEPKKDIPTFDSGPNVNGMITLPGNVDENIGIDKINVLSHASDFIKSESIRTIGDKDIYVYNNRFYEKVSEMTLMIGYILTPDTSAKVFFVLQGVPDSGKSVLTNLISKLISEEAVTTLDIHSYGEIFSISELYGKALAISPDLPARSLDSKAVGKIKQITGNDKVSTDVKYSSILKFKCSTKIMVATNHPLILKQKDDAFLRRTVVIPFRYPVADNNRDPYLLDNMLCERDLIITKSINA